MSSMVARKFRSADVTNLKGGYQEPFVIQNMFGTLHKFLIIKMAIMLNQIR
jgi:hypothetical protein